MSKGSRPRPFSVPLTELAATHETIFGVKPKREQYVPPALPTDYYNVPDKKVQWQSSPPKDK